MIEQRANELVSKLRELLEKKINNKDILCAIIDLNYVVYAEHSKKDTVETRRIKELITKGHYDDILSSYYVRNEELKAELKLVGEQYSLF